MCDHGTDTMVFVLVPADLAAEGVATWKTKAIDTCIAPIVRALQVGGIATRGSCCGHGKADGEILLQDGRVLVIQKGEAMDAPTGQSYPYDEEYLRGLSDHQLGSIRSRPPRDRREAADREFERRQREKASASPRQDPNTTCEHGMHFGGFYCEEEPCMKASAAHD